MKSNLLTGIRELRAGLATGFMLLFAGYLLWNRYTNSAITLTPPLNAIIKMIGSFGVITVITTLAYLVGVSYLYGLETVVNYVQKWAIKKDREMQKHNRMVRHILNIIRPLSGSSIKRLNIKAKTFYINTAQDHEKTGLNNFIEKVAEDMLWIEGKLAGSELNIDFIRLNTEAHLRIGVGSLIPVVFLALLLELNFSTIDTCILVLIGIVGAYGLMLQGFYLHRKSLSMLAHHVADGVLVTPTMENLKLNNEEQ